MKRNFPHVIIYIVIYTMTVVCLALAIAGGVLLSSGLALHEHTAEYVGGAPSTCAVEGNYEFWRCTTCGKCFSDELLTVEISQSDTVIPKLPHVEETIQGTPATCSAVGTEGHRPPSPHGRNRLRRSRHLHGVRTDRRQALRRVQNNNAKTDGYRPPSAHRGDYFGHARNVYGGGTDRQNLL